MSIPTVASKERKFSKILIRLVLALVGPMLAAQNKPYTFTTLTLPFPGVQWSMPNGINDLGTIVGSYLDTKTSHGFVLQNGTYTTLDAPTSGFSFTGV